MLSFLSVTLIVLNAAALILSAFKFFSKWQKWWIPVLLSAALLHLFIDGFYQTLIPVYIVTLSLISVIFYKYKKSKPASGRGFIPIVRAVLWRLICAVCLISAIAFTWYFGQSRLFISNFTRIGHSDFSNLGWSEAFDEMNSLLKRDYAFGEWKRVDWESLYNEYSKEIAAAEKAGNKAAYCLALRRYLFSIPDGHVSIQGDDFGMQKAAIGGGFGFAAVQLSDGRVVVSILEEGSPAEESGIKWGAEIISWDERPVQNVIEEIPVLWGTASSMATVESLNIYKLQLLTRAPAGSSVSITFRNPEESSVRNTSLTAYDDSASTFRQSVMLDSPMPEKYIDWSILPNGYGYLSIVAELPIKTINPVGEVRKAVKAFIKADVPGVVLDLRLNIGGIDDMAPLMMSFFTSEPLFYEQVAVKDSKTGQLKIEGDISLLPSKPCYTGPVAMLVSNKTCSTGEGLPLIMQLLNRGPVLGFYGTEASFGMVSGKVKMPCGYIVKYPNGAALDRNGKILLDSDHTLHGGIQPDIKVPLDMEAIQAIFVDKRDYLLEMAVSLLESK